MTNDLENVRDEDFDEEGGDDQTIGSVDLLNLLSNDDLKELLYTAGLREALLKIAANSDSVQARVHEIFDAEFNSLPFAVRERLRCIAASVQPKGLAERYVLSDRGLNAGHYSAGRLALRRLIEPTIALATSTVCPAKREQWTVECQELCQLNMCSVMLVEIRAEGEKARVRFSILRGVEPDRPGNYLRPKKGTVQVRLFRLSRHDLVMERLGSYADGRFADSRQITLESYMSGEEDTWELEVQVQPNREWNPLI